jgi:hypothetical protein
MWTTPDSLKVAKNYVLGQISDDYACLNFRLCITKRNRKLLTWNNCCRESAFDLYFRFQVISRLSKVYLMIIILKFLIMMLFIISKVRSHLFSLIVLLQMKKMKIKFGTTKWQHQFRESLKKPRQANFWNGEVAKVGKRERSFDFKDQQKVNDFIKRQMKQDEMMKEFTKKWTIIWSNLKRKKGWFKEELQSEWTKLKGEKKSKALDELKNWTIQNEELLTKLDKFKKQ